MGRSLDRVLARNIGVLYGLQAVRYGVPLVLVPFLARVLEPVAWGVLAIAQGWALYLMVLIEYSFPAASTRTVAVHREDRARLQSLLEEVTTAKGLLIALGGGLAAVVGALEPTLRAEPRLFWMAMLAAGLQAANPYWLLNGLERMRSVATITAMERLAGLAMILVIVHGPADAWKVPAAQAVAALGALVASYGIVVRDYPLRRFRFGAALAALRSGAALFASTLAVRAYAASGVVLVGLLASAEAAGLYAAAERVVRAATGLLQPITQAVYPRMAFLADQDEAQMPGFLRAWLVRTTALGAVLSLALFAAAPWIVPPVLGGDYIPSIPLLQVLALLPLPIAVSQALGLYWMLPRHHDRAFVRITVAAAVLAIGAAGLVVPIWAARGMAWIAVGVEAFVALAMIAWLRYHDADPLRAAPRR